MIFLSFGEFIYIFLNLLMVRVGEISNLSISCCFFGKGRKKRELNYFLTFFFPWMQFFLAIKEKLCWGSKSWRTSRSKIVAYFHIRDSLMGSLSWSLSQLFHVLDHKHELIHLSILLNAVYRIEVYIIVFLKYETKLFIKINVKRLDTQRIQTPQGRGNKIKNTKNTIQKNKQFILLFRYFTSCFDNSVSLLIYD